MRESIEGIREKAKQLHRISKLVESALFSTVKSNSGVTKKNEIKTQAIMELLCDYNKFRIKMLKKISEESKNATHNERA